MTPESPNQEKVRWINDLHANGLTYEIVMLEAVESPVEPSQYPYWPNVHRNPTALHEAERWWIALGRAHGWELLNLSEGGQGCSGKFMSEFQRRRVESGTHPWTTPDYVESQRQRVLTNSPSSDPEVAKKISAFMTGFQRQRVESGTHPWTTPEYAESQRQRLLTDNPMSNPDSRRKVGDAHRGKTVSDETRAKISAKATERWSVPGMAETMKGADNPARNPEVAKKISNKAKARRARWCEEGKYVGTAAPFGFRLTAARDLIPLESEQRILIRMRELRDAGLIYRVVADQLNAENLLRRNGRPWTRQAVHHYLSVPLAISNR